jgi:hypothetical protein
MEKEKKKRGRRRHKIWCRKRNRREKEINEVKGQRI